MLCDVNCAPLWEEPHSYAHNVSALAKDCRFGSPSDGLMESSGEAWKKHSCGDEDSTNIDELSDLFSSMEEESDSDQAIDFSVFIEDEDALNVEEVSDVFTALEEVDPQVLMQQLEHQVEETEVSKEDVADAANIDLMADLFTSMEQANTTVVVEEPTEQYSAQELNDAENVDLLADMFTTLEDSYIQQQPQLVLPPPVTNDAVVDTAVSQQDWIDSLAIDSMSNLFTELEKQDEKKMSERASTPSLMVRLRAPLPAMQPRAPVVNKVDSRIFVPKFAVRIEGQRQPLPSHLPVQTMLAGPPSLLAGPPCMSVSSDDSREVRVGRWLEKRKARSWNPQPADSTISETRRACAAKRQRVKGRFTSEKNAFVSITALQQ